MVVMEKTRGHCHPQVHGRHTGSIMRIFCSRGAVIGLAGTLMGTAGGLGLCWILKTYQFIELPRNVYPMSTLPSRWIQWTWLSSLSPPGITCWPPLSLLEGIKGAACEALGSSS